MKKLSCVYLLGFLLSFCHITVSVAQESSLSQTILFHAPFDGTTQAIISQGDGKLLTADAIERNKILGTDTPAAIAIAKGEGRYGDALRFAAKTSQVVFYEGIYCGYKPHDWSGRVPVWL